MSPASGLPPLRRLVLPGLFVAALFAVFFFRQPGRPTGGDEWVFSGQTMGTTYTVKVVPGDHDESEREHLAATIQRVVDGVDQTMSTYISDSEVRNFNRHGTDPCEASQDMVAVVEEAQRVARLTRGAFDITVGPLVDLWGFGPSGSTPPPDAEALRALVAVTGFEQIEVNPETRVLRKARSDCRIDLSAIAKGFAVDRVAESLDERGYKRYMVEVGGEVRAHGRKANGEVWRIGIERPDSTGRSLHLALPLADLSLATSGDYRNFVIRDGVRVSHTIDPRTGYPISHNLASVSVIHASCMTADALATALEVLGPEEGVALAERHDIPALFLIREDEETYREVRTRVWTALTENTPQSAAVG